MGHDGIVQGLSIHWLPPALGRSKSIHGLFVLHPTSPWGPRVWASVHSVAVFCSFQIPAFESHSFQVRGEHGYVSIRRTLVVRGVASVLSSFCVRTWGRDVAKGMHEPSHVE